MLTKVLSKFIITLAMRKTHRDLHAEDQTEKALDNKIMFDGSSIEGFARIEESDMYLYPDYDTYETFPWRPQQGKVARLICDVYKPDGTPFEGDPRYVLKRALAEAKEMGYTMNVGPECEFFLFQTDENGMPTTNTYERASYFDLGPLDFGENARRDMVLTLEQMGFEIEASHHRDIQTGCKDYCQETWSLRNIHAKAKVWRMRFRYAYEHVAPEGWQEHICR